MRLQAFQHLAARLTELGVGKFFHRFAAHVLHRLTQQSLLLPRLRRVEGMPQTLPIDRIEMSNAAQPRECPGRQLRPTLAHAHEVSSHMSPTERQHHPARFHLGHGFVAGGPVRRILVQQDMGPNRGAIVAFGDQLRRWRGREGSSCGSAMASRPIASPPNPTAIGPHVDLQHVGVLRGRHQGGRLPAMRTDPRGFRQGDELLLDRQMGIVASIVSRSGRAARRDVSQPPRLPRDRVNRWNGRCGPTSPTCDQKVCLEGRGFVRGPGQVPPSTARRV